MEELDLTSKYVTPPNGEFADELKDFIKNETPLDEYLREKRCIDGEIESVKERVLALTNEINTILAFMDYAFARFDKAYKKQVDNGSSEKDNIH